MSILDRSETEEYIRLHAQAAPINKRLEELKKKILPQLVAGVVSPSDLPFLLVNRPQNKPKADWKGYALALLCKLYRRSKDAKAKAEADIEAADKSWPTVKTPALHVVINPQYAAAVASPKTEFWT